MTMTKPKTIRRWLYQNHDLVHEWRLSQGERVMLKAMHRRKRWTAKSIGDVMDCTESYIKQTLVKLYAKGYIDRAPLVEDRPTSGYVYWINI